MKLHYVQLLHTLVMMPNYEDHHHKKQPWTEKLMRKYLNDKYGEPAGNNVQYMLRYFKKNHMVIYRGKYCLIYGYIMYMAKDARSDPETKHLWEEIYQWCIENKIEIMTQKAVYDLTRIWVNVG